MPLWRSVCRNLESTGLINKPVPFELIFDALLVAIVLMFLFFADAVIKKNSGINLQFSGTADF